MKRTKGMVVALLCMLLPMALGANQLKHHPSPYLALHGDDPVDWRPWGKEALEKARRERKLIFVSVGYFSCHWCHVMQRESFSDPRIAKVLNRYYVSIKVDRELDPALDKRLMDFVQATTGRGGWPMNVFLTPEGYPVHGLTYASPARFMRIIEELRQRWASSRDELEAAARDVDTALARQRATEDSLLDDDRTLDRWQAPLVETLMDVADTLKGGFGNQAKFPSAPQLWALLELGRGKDVEAFLHLTLDTMATHGLRDLVGGGFFRYTVDPDWETPHYEKMLYTNALLAMLYLRAAERFDRPDYRDVALDTLRFMAREMKAPGGAFISSLSAVDKSGAEGAYYLWSQKQLRKVLSDEEMDLVNVGWAMNRYGNDEAEVLPLQVMSDEELARQFDLSSAVLRAKMAAIREKLQQARARTRSLPRDDKRLTAWNGMALYALAEAAAAGDADAREQARALRDFIVGTLWRNGQLLRAVDVRGRAMGAGGLADHAWAALGLLRWSEVGGDAAAGKLGRRLIQAAWHRFHSDKGWRETEQTLLPRPLIRRHLTDGALPSPEAILLRATRLSLAMAPDDRLAKRLAAVIATPTRSFDESLYWYASLIAVTVVTRPRVDSSNDDTR